jgi:hypothetical protein
MRTALRTVNSGTGGHKFGTGITWQTEITGQLMPRKVGCEDLEGTGYSVERWYLQ